MFKKSYIHMSKNMQLFQCFVSGVQGVETQNKAIFQWSAEIKQICVFFSFLFQLCSLRQCTVAWKIQVECPLLLV